MNKIAAGSAVLMLGAQPPAAVQGKAVEDKHEDVTLTDYLFWDDAMQGPRPGVLVIHAWWELNDCAKRRAQMPSEFGYLAFSADRYSGSARSGAYTGLICRDPVNDGCAAQS